jgi:hypothetical protein
VENSSSGRSIGAKAGIEIGMTVALVVLLAFGYVVGVRYRVRRGPKKLPRGSDLSDQRLPLAVKGTSRTPAENHRAELEGQATYPAKVNTKVSSGNG